MLTTIPPARPEIMDPPPPTMLKTTTAARLQGYHFPPLEFFVEGLIPEGWLAAAAEARQHKAGDA